jgi:hypothetical protein
VQRGVELRLGCGLAIACVARLDAHVGEFGAKCSDLVFGLDHVGAQPVEHRSQLADRHVALAEVGSEADSDLFRCSTALLLAPQRGSQICVRSLVGALGDESIDTIGPPLRALQPQDPDRIDELGQRTRCDRVAERLVGVDRPAQTSERSGGDPRLGGDATELARHRNRGLAFGDLVGHHDGVLDGTAQVAVLDRGRVGHVRTLPDRPHAQNGCS